MNRSAFIEDLRTFVQEETGIDGSKISDSVLLFESGLVDSITLVALVAHCEDLLDRPVDLAELSEENFGSLERIADFFQLKAE